MLIVHAYYNANGVPKNNIGILTDWLSAHNAKQTTQFSI